MIFERIRLQDCYSHEDTDIDLTATPYAVIRGHNGAGKSTLMVDGPLFALYGARAVRGATLSDVVRQGAESATATVQFVLGGKRYRVTRTYSIRTKRGTSDLEFVYDDRGVWRPVVTGSIGVVDQAIADLLGADYTAFTLGAIMRQGESSRFTAATPGERVEALSQLLGVEHLKTLYTEAGARERAITDRIETLTRSLESTQEAVQALARHREHLLGAEGRLEALEVPDEASEADLAKVISGADVEIEALEAKVASWFDLASKIRVAESDQARATKAIADADKSIRDAREEVRALNEGIKGRPEVSAAELEARIDHLSKVVGAAEVLVDRINNGAGVIEDLAAEIAGREKIVAEANIDPDARGKLERVQQDLKRLAECQMAVKEALAEFDKYDREVSRLEVTIDHTRGRAKPIEDRPGGMDLALCRPCGLLKGAVEALDSLRGLEDSIGAAKDARGRARASVLKLASEWGVDDAAGLADLERQLKGDAQVLELALVRSEELDRVRVALDRDRERLASYQAARDGLKDDLDKLIADAGASTLDDLNAVLVGMRIDLEAAREADKVQAQIERLEAKILDLEAALDASESEASEAEASLVSLNEQVESGGLRGASDRLDLRRASRGEARQKLLDLQAKNRALSAARAELDKEIAVLKANIDRLGQDAARAKEIQAEIDAEKDREQLLKYARRFFRMAPQIVVASAVPQIEIHANEILGEIAPSFRVEVTQQRQTQTGTVRDEINVLVTIGGAARDYQSLSGGERFRVDVALRLALARVATARADRRSLDTLIVDEGWGCLDDEGVQALRDTFVRLRDRFRAIYVISHVDLSGLFEAEITLNGGQRRYGLYRDPRAERDLFSAPANQTTVEIQQ